MPNFDGGHYFLTVLLPVRLGVYGGAGRDSALNGVSYRHRLQDVLAKLPNSEVTELSHVHSGQSAFARNTMTHLARFVLIDGPAFNGRVSGDTLLGKLSGVDPSVPQKVDGLSTPYLLFAADFDAPDGADAALRVFTNTLWATMRAEITDILSTCYGFDKVGTEQEFFAYLKRGQIETTMPFSAYYTDDQKLPPDLPLPLDKIMLGAKVLGGIVAVWLLAFLLAAVLPTSGFRDSLSVVARWGLLIVPLLIAAAAVYIYWLYRSIMSAGLKPFPPGAKLPEVLKALYLQQQFMHFAIAQQGKSDAELHAAFGAFVATHRPGDLAGPTQIPGVIRLPKETLA